MYWPSPEESEVSNCEGIVAAERCSAGRRSVCYSLPSLVETENDRDLASPTVGQMSASIYYGSVDTDDQTATRVSKSDLASPRTANKIHHAPAQDIVGGFSYLSDVYQYSPSAAE